MGEVTEHSHARSQGRKLQCCLLRELKQTREPTMSSSSPGRQPHPQNRSPSSDSPHGKSHQATFKGTLSLDDELVITSHLASPAAGTGLVAMRAPAPCAVRLQTGTGTLSQATRPALPSRSLSMWQRAHNPTSLPAATGETAQTGPPRHLLSLGTSPSWRKQPQRQGAFGSAAWGT